MASKRAPAGQDPEPAKKSARRPAAKASTEVEKADAPIKVASTRADGGPAKELALRPKAGRLGAVGATHQIQTTMRPDLTITVSETEYQSLLAQGLVYSGSPVAPVADFYDGILADKVANGAAFPQALGDAAADSTSPFGSELRAAYASRIAATDATPLRELVRAGAITAATPLVGSGDSHTDYTTSASYLWDRLTTVRNQPGEGLEDVAANAIVPLGYNGMTLSVWQADPTKLAALQALNPSVIFACWLVNDVRQGALGLTTAAIRAAGSARLLQFIDAVRAAVPGVLIALRVPAPFLTVDVSSAHYVTDGTTTNPAGLAQIYTDGLRYAYYDAARDRPGVLLYDPQSRLFGHTSPTAIGTLYANQIHQSPQGYIVEADDFAAWVGAQMSWSQTRSLDAVSSAPATPWTTYYRDVEDPARYALLGIFTLTNANPTTYLDLLPDEAPPVPGNITRLDVVEIVAAKTTFQLPASGISLMVSGPNVRITGLNLSGVTAAAKTKVRVYRRITGSDSAVNTVLLDTTWRYKRTGYVVGGNTTFLDVGALSYGAAIATQPASEWSPQLVAGDKVYVEGQGGAPLTVGTNATAGTNGNNLRLTGLTGGVDFSALVGKQVVIVGTHA